MEDRSSPSKRLSDAFLPPWLVDYLFIPLFKLNGADVNGWTGMHALSGSAVAFLMPGRFWYAQGIHLVWEGFQWFIGDNDFEETDTPGDILNDQVAFTLGWLAYHGWPTIAQ